MAKLYNLARMTTATTGTGTITLGSAATSYLSFADAGVQNGETVTYAIVDGSNREVGRGVYTSSGTTLTRATILESTNSNNAINLSGSAEVFITAAAEDITSSVEITGGSITGITDLAIADGGTGQSTASAAANALDGYLEIVASAGTTTLTNTSARNIVVTGSTTHTIRMPDVTTLSLGWTFTITNTSSNLVTLQSSGANNFVNPIGVSASVRLVCIAVTGTGTASWALQFIGAANRSGTGNAVFSSNAALTTPTIAQISGGSAASSTLTLQSTSGAGTTDAIIFRTASQSERFRIDTSGALGVGGTNYGTSGQVLTSNGSGAAPSWQTATASSMTLLGTITTTSGSSLNLTGLNLTTYKSLYISVNSVSSSSATDDLSITDGAGNSILIMTDSNNATHVFSAIILISLEGGGIMVSGQTDASTVYAAGTGNTGSGTAGAKCRFGRVNLTTASTSLGFSVQTGFDAGSITVYGVK